MVFGNLLAFVHQDRVIRIAILIIFLGIFSAVYTYFGGLNAVVKTDIIQFSVLLIGGILVCLTAVNHLGGWEQLYIKTPDKMHLHLPADHPTLPWTHLFGLFFFKYKLLVCQSNCNAESFSSKKHYACTNRIDVRRAD